MTAPICSCNFDGRYTEGDIPPEITVPIPALFTLRRDCEVHRCDCPECEKERSEAISHLRAEGRV